MNKEAQVTQLVLIQELLGVCPDLLLAHHPLPTSAEDSGVYSGALSIFPQGHATETMPWEPQH